MYGGGRYATAATRAMGRMAEVRFMRICGERYGYRYRVANRKENVVDHFDFVIQGGSKVDVKAMKSARRGGPVDPNIVYVELKNVSGGNGWLYGKADYIAFEQPTGFLFIDRRELASFVNMRRPYMRRAEYSGVYNTLYSRKGRNDEVAIFHMHDIMSIHNKFFLYGN